MPLDPRFPEFWAQEGRHLWDSVAELAMQALAAGGVGGELLLPEGIRQLISWDVFNQSALDYLRQYRLSTVAGINQTTASQAIAAIEDWVKEGAALPVLEARFVPIFGDARASNIATTEVTRLFYEGNMMSWEASGVVSARKWNTAMDDLRCPGCKALQGQVAPMGQPFYIPDDAIARDPELRKWVQYFGQIFQGAPAHSRCRCYAQPVVTQRALERELERMLPI